MDLYFNVRKLEFSVILPFFKQSSEHFTICCDMLEYFCSKTHTDGQCTIRSIQNLFKQKQSYKTEKNISPLKALHNFYTCLFLFFFFIFFMNIRKIEQKIFLFSSLPSIENFSIFFRHINSSFFCTFRLSFFCEFIDVLMFTSQKLRFFALRGFKWFWWKKVCIRLFRK